MTSTIVSTVERIRTLNDAFRRTFVGGMVMITAGVAASAAFGKSIVTTHPWRSQ